MRLCHGSGLLMSVGRRGWFKGVFNAAQRSISYVALLLIFITVVDLFGGYTFNRYKTATDFPGEVETVTLLRSEGTVQGAAESAVAEAQTVCEAVLLARELVDQVTHTSRDLLSIAALTASLNVDGHRADLVILKAARAEAAFEGRTRINDHDIALAAELALPHRIKRTPFQQAEMTTEQLQERIEQLAGQSVPSEAEEESESQQNKAEEKKT